MLFESAQQATMSVQVPNKGVYRVQKIHLAEEPPLVPAQQIISGLESVSVPSCATPEDLVREANARSKHVYFSLSDKRLKAELYQDAFPAGYYDGKKVYLDGADYKMVDHAIYDDLAQLFRAGERIDFERDCTLTGTTSATTVFGQPALQCATAVSIPRRRVQPAAPEYFRASDSIAFAPGGRVKFAGERVVLSLRGRNSGVLIRSPFIGLMSSRFKEVHHRAAHFPGFALHAGELSHGVGVTSVAAVPADSKQMICQKTAAGMDVSFVRADDTIVLCIQVAGAGDIVFADHDQQCIEIEPPVVFGAALDDRDGCECWALSAADGTTPISSAVGIVSLNGTVRVNGVDSGLAWSAADHILELERTDNQVKVTLDGTSATVTVAADTHAADAATVVAQGVKLGASASCPVSSIGVIKEESGQNTPVTLGAFLSVGFADGTSATERKIVRQGVTYAREGLILSPDMTALLGVGELTQTTVGTTHLPQKRVQMLVLEYKHKCVAAGDKSVGFLVPELTPKFELKFLDGVTKQLTAVPVGLTWSLTLSRTLD